MPELTRITAVAYGRRFAVDVPRRLESAAALRLPIGWSRSPGPPERVWRLAEGNDGLWTAAHDGEVFGGGDDPIQALELLTGDVELWVAEHAEGLVFVHAGAVAWHGGAIVIPGRTRTGKTSLVAALVRAGAQYLSDEYAIIDDAGLVHPYARPLSLRSPGGGAGTRTAVQELGGVTAAKPVSVRIVAHVRFDPSGGWNVAPISRATALLALMENTVPARTRAELVMNHLQAAVRSAAGLAGRRGEAADAAQQLLSHALADKGLTSPRLTSSGILRVKSVSPPTRP